ncbi:hypothetical protein Tco_1573149, partial [Tanacetum coccineum]
YIQSSNVDAECGSDVKAGNKESMCVDSSPNLEKVSFNLSAAINCAILTEVSFDQVHRLGELLSYLLKRKTDFSECVSITES